MMLSSVAGRMIVSCCLLERLILCQLLWPDQTVIRSTIVVCVCSCSDQLDAIAQKKLVNFVHDLMTQYFDFVCRRVQLEVLSPLHLCVCVCLCYVFAIQQCWQPHYVFMLSRLSCSSGEILLSQYLMNGLNNFDKLNIHWPLLMVRLNSEVKTQKSPSERAVNDILYRLLYLCSECR